MDIIKYRLLSTGKATRNSSGVIRIYSQIFAGIALHSPHKFDEISKIGIIYRFISGYAPLVHKHPVSHLLLMCFLKLGSRFTIFNNEISCDNVSFRGYRFVTVMSLELNYGTYVIIRSHHVKCGWVPPSGRSANHENLYHDHSKFKLGDPLKKQIAQDGPSEGD